jgi:hypothetical protein
VHAEGEDPGVVLKQSGCSISLMDVQIYDKDAFDGTIPKQNIGCNGDIVEQAEPLAPVCKRVPPAM